MKICVTNLNGYVQPRKEENMNIEYIMTILICALGLGTIARYLNEGLLDAIGIQQPIFKKVVVFGVNGLIVYWYCGTQLVGLQLVEYVMIYLFVCAGAETVHEIIKQLNDNEYIILDEVKEDDEEGV